MVQLRRYMKEPDFGEEQGEAAESRSPERWALKGQVDFIG